VSVKSSGMSLGGFRLNFVACASTLASDELSLHVGILRDAVTDVFFLDFDDLSLMLIEVDMMYEKVSYGLY